jgi:hypothetical protein
MTSSSCGQFRWVDVVKHANEMNAPLDHRTPPPLTDDINVQADHSRRIMESMSEEQVLEAERSLLAENPKERAFLAALQENRENAPRGLSHSSSSFLSRSSAYVGNPDEFILPGEAVKRRMRYTKGAPQTAYDNSPNMFAMPSAEAGCSAAEPAPRPTISGGDEVVNPVAASQPTQHPVVPILIGIGALVVIGVVGAKRLRNRRK